MRGLWSGLNTARRVMHLIVLLVIFGALFALMADGKKAIIEKTTLVLSLEGDIVEQFSGSPSDRFWAGVTGEEVKQVRLRDVRRVLQAAAKDARIVQVLLRTDELGGVGVATLREVAAALTEFRKSGKKIVSYSYGYGQRGLFLAAHTDRVYLHPEGLAMLEGLGRNRVYYASMLQKLGVKPHVFRVGEFKSAVEPYLLDGPSDAAREADAFWLNDLWNIMLNEYAAARKLKADDLKLMLEELPARLAAHNGNFAELALAESLVDELATPDQINDLMLASGVQDKESKSYRRASYAQYLAQLDAPKSKDEKIAIIVAEGGIADGKQPPGSIGGDSTAKLVREARLDDKVKALVLRVDSPGGSGFASEIIRREIELTRKAGKPVVVSMGDVAASGGYWIAMTSDAIFADPATITGSIGIFGIFPSVAEGLDKIGVHSDGTSTAWVAGAMDLTRPLDPRLGEVLDTAIKHGYQNFIGKVAESRNTTTEAIDNVARGRVWSAGQAKERGLIDVLGGLDDAVADAAKRAKLSDYELTYVEPKLSGFEKILADLGGASFFAGAFKHFNGGLHQDVLKAVADRGVERDLQFLLQQSQKNPLALYSYCFCESP